MTLRHTGVEAGAADWFKSTHSDNQGGGDCVRVALNFATSHGFVLIGDTKTPNSHLVITPEAYAAFVSATAQGEFDLT
ncbi:DUF397 domain-containing protein [Kitasatospora purpeofusca]|uniref:DUF397 domain-containing protein n=1 Tax=Kitasatospora purpeofusca TaxID=67352 RepID=UPI0036D28DCC